MIQSIKKTLKRLSGKIYIFNPVEWYPLFLEGISTEFNRVREFKNQVLNSTVPNDNMDVNSIDDYNKKYGIPSIIGGTDAEKISRIIEKASLSGYPGKDWFQEQIQKAGFQLYVICNDPRDSDVRQWGTFQWGTTGVQYGLTTRFIDPDTIPGDLVVSSPPYGAGRVYLNRYSTFQWGTPGVQWGTLDPDALNPQPFQYRRTTSPTYWGFYFTLSPFSDRVATDESEFLTMSQNEYNYLCQIILELKLQRNWCILQSKVI